MYVWAAFEAKSPPTRQDLATLIPNNSLYLNCIKDTFYIVSKGAAIGKTGKISVYFQVDLVAIEAKPSPSNRLLLLLVLPVKIHGGALGLDCRDKLLLPTQCPRAKCFFLIWPRQREICKLNLI